MTLIFKSNKKSSVNLGNINGFLGPDDWLSFMDFSRGDIKQKINGTKQTVLVSELLECNRQSPAYYINDAGRLTLADAGVMRVGRSRHLNNKGLIVEPTRINLVENPNNPANQTIVIPNVGSGVYVSAWMEGSGTVTLSGSITGVSESGSSFVIDRNKGAVFTVHAGENKSINVNVEGDVSFLQLERNTTDVSESSRIDFGTRYNDAITLKQTPIEFTVLVDVDVREIKSETTKRLSLLAAGDSQNNITLVYTQNAIGARIYKNGDQFDVLSEDRPQKITIAVSYDGSVLQVAFGGQVYSLEGALVDLGDLSIGGSNFWRSDSNTDFNGVFKRIVVYDRALSRPEMLEASMSF